MVSVGTAVGVEVDEGVAIGMLIVVSG